MPTIGLRMIRFVALPAVIAVGLVAASSASATGGDDVVGQLKLIAREEAGSCERLLERAAAVVNRAWLDKPWSEAERDLKAAGIAIGETDAESYSYRCLLLSDAWNSGWGLKMDLYVDVLLLIGGDSGDTFDARFAWANVGLTAKVSALSDEVRKQRWFRSAAVVQAGLESRGVADSVAEFPILDVVDLSTPGEKEDSETGGTQLPYGLTLELVDRKGDWTRRRRLTYSANTKRLRGSERREPIEAYSRRDFGGRSAVASLAGDLARLAREKEPSYQRLLWKATRLVQRATLDRNWTEVAAALDLLSLPNRDRFPGAGDDGVVYRVAAGAFTTEAGQAMDLEIRFETAFAVSRVAPTREVVVRAFAVLRADVGKSRREVVDQGRFGKETAVHLALTRPETEKWSGEFPIVHRVSVYYDSSGFEDPEGDPCGFFVEPELVRTPGDASTGARPEFFFASSLDPLQYRGREFAADDHTAPFVPRDLLGEVEADEGSSWSEPDVSFAVMRKATPNDTTAQPGRPADDGPPATVAYGLGDLLAMPADTRSVRINSIEFYNDDLAVLGRFSELEVLDLEWVDRISDESLDRLPRFKKLRSLTIWGADGTGFRRLAGRPELRELNVFRAWQLTDEGIAAIAELRQLTRLSLRPAEGLTDRQLAELAKLENLQELELSGARYFDASVRPSALISPDLPPDEQPKWITEAGIDELAALPNLRKIRLCDMELTELAARRLGRIRSLETVELHSTEITAEGLHVLLALPRLRRLTIEKSKTISQADVAELKKNLPKEFELSPHEPEDQGSRPWK